MDKSIALSFARSDQQDESNKVSVVLKIQLKSKKNFFIQDCEDYHAFLAEREIIL